jgi:hypothetical protein
MAHLLGQRLWIRLDADQPRLIRHRPDWTSGVEAAAGGWKARVRQLA